MSRAWFTLLCLLLAAGFATLGVWQLDRRAWKLDLIGRVEARLAAEPVAPPRASAWSSINSRDHEYRKVRVQGVLLTDRETRVQALTELGAGWWVMTPLRTEEGVILINRGFVPADQQLTAEEDAAPPAAGAITGLMRMTEPHGVFLRRNDPAADRWYSRDVAAIGQARGLFSVAPFFIDADARPNPGGYPVGGLTVVAFRNTHLVYALTWFGLAAISLVGTVLVVRSSPGDGDGAHRGTA